MEDFTLEMDDFEYEGAHLGDTQEEVTPEVKLGELVKAAFGLYAQKEELEKQVKDISSQLTVLESSIKEQLESNGLESVKTDAGTMFLQQETYPKILDFDELLKFAYEAGIEGSALIQKRISSTAFKEYFKEHGAFPPGTDAEFANKLGRRRAK